MLTITFDGSGTVDGTTQYINGVALPVGPKSDGMNGSIANSGVLKLGHNNATACCGGNEGQGIDANIYFVEIYDHVLTAQEITDRWNNGSPARATVSPDRPSVTIDTFGFADTIGYEITSVTGISYQLQSSVDTNTMVWDDAGGPLEGIGGAMTLFDPNGHDSNRTYRVVGL